MTNLTNKRLLLLGGSLWKEAIKDFAEKHNITLIATGNDTTAGVFEIAHECYSIDSTDADAMKKFIVEKQIDGVYMGGSEPVISVACTYLNELGLPCYCTKAQWELLQNKSQFKQLLIENDLPVAPKYDILSFADIDSKLNDIKFPVITKPTDGCGSNGFSVCNNAEELKAGYERASAASASGSVIVEKFVRNDGVVVFYTFSNGKMYFSGLEDKYPVKYNEQGSYVAGMHIFESKFKDEFRNRFDEKLERMYSSIGIKEGSVWIEVFHDGDDYYFNEAGYRYSGSVSIYPVDYFYGINQVASDIYYALTGESVIFNHDSLIKLNKKKKFYTIYSLHLNPGVIWDVKGIRELEKDSDVVVIPITKGIGTKVCSTGSIAQVYGFVHFVFDTNEELFEMIKKIHTTIIIDDGQGNNMLARIIDLNLVKQRL